MIGRTVNQERVRKGAAEIAARLRRDITNGKLANQERLHPERELAAEFGVARGTVREALTQLAADGFVETRRGSGTYVTYDVDPDIARMIREARPSERFDLRCSLEPHACRLAVMNAREAEFDAMEAALRSMESNLHDPEQFAMADIDFHNQVAASTGNSIIRWLVDRMHAHRYGREWERMRKLAYDADAIVQFNRQHRQILTAMRQRDPDAAARYMMEHLHSVRVCLRQSASI